MLRLLGPTLLTLSLAFPGASLALGLGEIHVESTLHQTLVAQIDLIGATNEELARLAAGIADEEIFYRYNLQRPAFLSGTTVVVGQDRQGHPVLVLRSSETFTEPLVTFLVDLHSPAGELIREYTVLLDPPGLASKPGSLESTPAMPEAETQTSAAVTTAPERAVASPDVKSPKHTYTVAPRDTLDRIARMAGAHSRSERHRMMIAVFRANPGAFQTNLNVLHRGATLHFPTAEQLSAISAEAADREYEAQIAAWRASNHRKSPTAPASEAVAPNPILDAKPDTESPETDKSVLTERVASLEKSLHKLRRELEQPLVKKTMAPVAPRSAHSSGAITNQSYLAGARAPATHSRIPFALLAVTFGLVLAAGAWFLRRRRNGDNPPTVPHVIQQSSLARTMEDQAGEAMPPLSQRARGASLSGERAKSEVRQASSKASDGEPSWFKDSFSTPIDEILAGEVAGDTVEQKLSFFTPDSNTNTTYVRDILSGLWLTNEMDEGSFAFSWR